MAYYTILKQNIIIHSSKRSNWHKLLVSLLNKLYIKKRVEILEWHQKYGTCITGIGKGVSIAYEGEYIDPLIWTHIGDRWTFCYSNIFRQYKLVIKKCPQITDTIPFCIENVVTTTIENWNYFNKKDKNSNIKKRRYY